jgi:thymidylate synthase (FAD)
MTPDPLGMIELAGRTCYKSEDKIIPGSAGKFVKMLLDRGHEAMIEHASMSYGVACDRGVSHEIIRHRLFSYAQESTRYCNYTNKEMEFIRPSFLSDFVDKLGYDCQGETGTIWMHQIKDAETAYKKLILLGENPQIARSVLPNSLKTSIVITGNLREWRHFFKMRTAKTAHPQMQEVALLILNDASMRIPIVFDDLYNRGVVMAKCQNCKKEVKRIYRVTLECILGEKQVHICRECKEQYPVAYFEEANHASNDSTGTSEKQTGIGK